MPVSTTQQFGTYEANQETADIRIMENIISDDEATLKASSEIGNAALPIPPGLPAGSPIEITFELNEQGRLHAIGRDLTGNHLP